jgi:glycosyltransferase involved in cell wall biosynthesis
VLHVHNVHTSPLLAAKMAGVPARVWSKLSMSSWYEEGVQPKGWRKLALSTRVSGACAHKILCLSSVVSEEAAQHGVSRAKLAVLPGSVDLESLSAIKREDARRHFGLDPSDRVISTVGHAVRVKGWDILIKAFGSVAREFPRAQLWLIGSHTDEHERATYESLASMLAKLKLSDRVWFLGRRDDIPMLLGASDVFAFPSRSEGQGSALTEAMAAGLPCVACAVGGIVDSMEHGQNGMLVPREDASALAAAMKSLLADASLRDRLGQSAAEAAQQYGHFAYVDSLMRVYGDLLGSKVRTENNLAEAGV